jgi:hypothetical protein
MHVRQQIREHVGTILSGLTSTGNRVYQSRVWPLNADTLPALLVYTTTESSDTDTMGPTLTLNRELVLIVEGYVRDITVYDDKIDTISSEVEVAMAADRTLGGKAKFSYLSGTEINYNGEGDQPMGIVSLQFTIQYRTAVNDPDTGV